MMRVVIAIMIGVSGYLVFEFGRIQADFNIIDRAHERQAFEDRIEQLESDIRSLHEQVTLLETHRDIDRGAYTDVELSLVSLQAKIQEAKERYTKAEQEQGVLWSQKNESFWDEDGRSVTDSGS